MVIQETPEIEKIKTKLTYEKRDQRINTSWGPKNIKSKEKTM